MNVHHGTTRHRIGAGKIGAMVALGLALVGTLTARSVGGSITNLAAAGPLAWGPSAHSLQLSISGTDSVYQNGAPIKICLSIRNSGSPVAIIRNDFWEEYPFEVRREDGTLVQRLAVPSILDSSSGQYSYVLKRGTVYQTHLDLDRLFKLNPGDYSIRASSMIHPYNESTQQAEPGGYSLTSNVLHIHVQ